MVTTAEFQHQISEKLTTVFSRSMSEIERTTEWTNLFAQIGDIVINHRYQDLTSFKQIHHIDIENSDVANLFVAKTIANNEYSRINEHVRRIRAKRPRPQLLLECLYEPVSRYYDNDQANVGLDHKPGKLIYCPVVDIAIAPSLNLPGNKKNSSIGIYPLMNGHVLFEALSQLSTVQTLIEGFGNVGRRNMSRIGIGYNDRPINNRPLYLMAIEIENQTNKKHLMGDFFNSLMLSRHPIVIVPNSKLGHCLELVQLVRKIFDIKSINVSNFFERVAILKFDQFKEIIDPVLTRYNLEPLDIEGLNE